MLLPLSPPAVRRASDTTAVISGGLRVLALAAALLVAQSSSVFGQTSYVWVQTADPAVAAGAPEVRAMQSARAEWEKQARRPFSPQQDRRRVVDPSRGAVYGAARPMPPAARQPSSIKQARYAAPGPLAADPGYGAAPQPTPDAAMPYDGMAPVEEGEPLLEGPGWQFDRRAFHGRGMCAPGMACDACGDWGGACFSEYPGRACGWCWRPFHNRLWLREEYILWWGKGDFLPSLATISVDLPPPESAGVLGEDSTRTLFGGTAVNDQGRSGIRDTIGYWLDDDQYLGLEGIYWVHGSTSASFQAASPTTEILARPFLDVQTGLESAFLVVYPDLRTGSLSIREIREIEGAEFLVRRNFFRDCVGRADLLFGYRYARLGDTLQILESTTALEDDPILGDPAGTIREVFEAFDTTNEFHGGQVGVAGQWQFCHWSLELLMKVALGSTSSRARVFGRTALNENGAVTESLGGILAQQTNIGRFQRREFSMIPELGITLTRNLGCHLRATVGYTLIYWSKVMRPGENMDLNLNITQVPPGDLIGAPEPAFSFATNDFWIHGLNLGIEYRF